jgi:Bacterial Ig-like domain (group 3)
MNIRRWIYTLAPSLFGSSAFGRKPAPHRNRYRPMLEHLEDRTVPTGLSVGTNINISQLSGNQAETTISINPTNVQNLFASETFSGMCRYSTDGGSTWTNSNMSALPSTIGDVQTAWDSYGNLFITRLGASNQAVVVAYSTNGGATFGNVQTVLSSGGDQPSIAVGANSVWVSVSNSSGDLVAAGASVTGLGTVGSFGSLQTAPGPGGDFGDIAIGPSGQVLVVYQDPNSGTGPDTIKANLDSNGLTSGGFASNTVATNTNVGGFDAIPPQPSRTIDAEANLAWDRSGGAHNGRVYLVYVDATSVGSNNTDIYVRHSDNNGSTWSSAVKVNDDTTTNSQLQPAIAVDQSTGNIAVTWYDCRNAGSADVTVQLFGAVSTDGGATFSPNVQISAGTTNATVAAVGSFNLGDYDKMDFASGVFYRTWGDNSNSTGNNPNGTLNALDMYTAKVTLTVPTITPSTASLPNTSTSMTINGTGFDTTVAHDSVSFDNGVTGIVTSATSTSLIVSLTGLGSVTAGTALHASVTVDGFSSGSPVQVATVVAATTTSLTDNGPNPSTVGQSVSFTATVSGGSPINGQTVFIEDASNSFIVVASPTLVNSTVNFTISDLPVGSHHLIAVYNGDTTHAGSNDSGSLTPVIQVVNAAPAPQFVSIEANGGTVQYHDAFGNGSAEPIADQNSVVEQILVTFNEPVTLDPGAFTVVPFSISTDGLAHSGQVLVNSGPNPNQVAPIVNTPVLPSGGDGHQWILTFGNNAATTPNGSGFYVLKDGVYSVNIDHTKVHANSQNMAADVTGPGPNSFWALYGDTTFHDISGVDHPGYVGDTYSEASVGAADFAGFKGTYNSDSTNEYAPPSYNIKFDANLDGSVANSDFVQFKTNYNADWQF